MTGLAPLQLNLKFRREMQPVDARAVAAQGSMTDAIRLCQQLSGLSDKELVGEDGIVKDLGQWSRIKGGQHFFPQDRLNDLMDVCGNEAPLIWLAQSRGYELVLLESEAERRFRAEREKAEALQRENALLKNLLVGKTA